MTLFQSASLPVCLILEPDMLVDVPLNSLGCQKLQDVQNLQQQGFVDIAI